MASEKNLFKKAFGYLKYELINSTYKDKDAIKQEMLYWLKYWSYEDKNFQQFPLATQEEIMADFSKELFNPPAYKRTNAMAEVLENDFDRLIEEQAIKARTLVGADE